MKILLIESSSARLWQHPDIEAIVLEHRDPDSDQFFTGPWLLFRFGKLAAVACIDPDDYEDHFACYEKFNDSFDVAKASAISQKLISSVCEELAAAGHTLKLRGGSFSPDVCVHTEDGLRWSYST